MKTQLLLTAVSAIGLCVPVKAIAEEQAESPPTFRIPCGTETEQRIREKISKDPEFQLIFEDNTGREVVQYISDFGKLPIYIASDDAFADVVDQTRFTGDLRQCTISDVLNLLCEKASAEFLVEDSLLKIVPEAVAEERFETVVYDLTAFEDAKYPTQDLPAALRKTVAPGTWARSKATDSREIRTDLIDSPDGQTVAAAVRTNTSSSRGNVELVPGGMVVYQSPRVQREVERTLQQLWTLARQKKGTAESGGQIGQ